MSVGIPSVDSGFNDTDVSSPFSERQFDDVDDDEIPPINLEKRPDLGMGDQDLVLCPTKMLNKLLKKRGISKERAKEIKAQRRTLKNRGYAANCRVKREDEEKKLEVENDELRRSIMIQRQNIQLAVRQNEELEVKIRDLEEELERYAQQYGDLGDLSEIDEAFYEDDSIGFDSERLHKLSHNGLIIDVVPQ